MNQELEKTLWATADKLRNNMDAAEYKHIVLGLIFLKYISDSFEDLYNKLKEDNLSDAEDKDEYLAENVFYVPPSARWNYLQHQRAKLPSIGKDIDDAMDAIEKDIKLSESIRMIVIYHVGPRDKITINGSDPQLKLLDKQGEFFVIN